MLKNGKYQVRQYIINENQYAPLLKPIYESNEYKKAKYPIVAQTPKDIKLIEIGDNRTSKKPLILADSPEMKEFMTLFQNEVNYMTFEDIKKQFPGHAYIQITDSNNKSYHYSFRKDFESMVSWLKEKELYENLMLLPQDIEYAILRKRAENVQYDINGEIVNASNDVEIRDPEILKELLSLSETSQYIYEKEPIYVDFYIKSSFGNNSYRTPLYINVPVSDTLKGYIETFN